MIAYAIKNKEGKFWQFLHNDESEFVDEIYNAFFNYSKQDAEKTICAWGLKDCEVVEVTIAKGDLEQELAIYKQALELACRRIDYLIGDEDSEYMTDPFTFKLLAKEELDKGEK